MHELLQASCAPSTLPFSLFLLAVVAAWILVLLGALDDDAGDGLLPDLLDVHDVPTLIVYTLYALFTWMGAVVANRYLNPGSGLIVSLTIGLVVLVAATFAVRVALRPFAALFRGLDGSASVVEMVGLSGVVRSGEVTSEFGQVEVVVDGASVLVNARAAGGASYRRGDPVVLIERDPENGSYQVTGAL